MVMLILTHSYAISIRTTTVFLLSLVIRVEYTNDVLNVTLD